MSSRRLSCLIIVLVGGVLLASPGGAEVRPSAVDYRAGTDTVKIPLLQEQNRVWIDLMAMAKTRGVTPWLKRQVFVFKFKDYTLAINPRETGYSILLKGEKKWINQTLQERVRLRPNQMFVLLSDLPDLLRESFVYHRQKKTLTVRSESVITEAGKYRPVSLPHQTRDRQVWVALEELAKALSVVVYADRAQRFKLVMTDFSILELRVGESRAYRRDVPAVQMTDPILLFSGKPYVSLRSIGSLFEIETLWDASRNVLLLPARSGRTAELKLPKLHQLIVQGYAPEPLHLRLEEFSSYYQDPAPSFAYDHQDVYESVRDFLSNEPIETDNRTRHRIGGGTTLALKGNTAGVPMEGRGAFEKVGGTTRVISGTAQWGFPLFQISGGRDYTTMAGLNNQFNIVDQVVVSHSSDHFGDRERDNRVKFEAGYGEANFLVFQSTALFSQNAEFNQRYTVATAAADWALDSRQRLGLTLQHYNIENDVRDLSSAYNDEELFRDIFGDEAEITVDPADAEALLRSVLTDRHMTSLLNLKYSKGDTLDLSAVGALSNFKDAARGKRQYDTDWQVRSLLRHNKNRLDLSYERASDTYRALGNPLRYQNRGIFRAGTSLDLARFWTVLGDYRKEDNASLVGQGLDPFTNTYLTGTNLLRFSRNTIRTSVTEFESGLYGRRRTHSGNVTQYLGRHSADIGASTSKQWTSLNSLFRNSKTGKLGFQMAGADWKVSASEEYTHHDYPSYGLRRVESLTNVVGELKGWELLTEYHKESKYFRLEDYLHTGYARLGYSVRKDKVLGLFYSTTSLNSDLSHPEVWRAGIEFVTDLY